VTKKFQTDNIFTFSTFTDYTTIITLNPIFRALYVFFRYSFMTKNSSKFGVEVKKNGTSISCSSNILLYKDRGGTHGF